MIHSRDNDHASAPQSALVQLAGFCSLGAGLVHAAAVGLHVEHPPTARLFVVLALCQIGAGLLVVLGATWWSSASAVVAVNVAAVAGWVATRTTGISWISGLESPERPQVADTLCAVLGAMAVVAIALHVVWKPERWRASQPILMAGVATVLTVPAMWSGAGHVHSHNDAPRETAFQIGADGVILTTSTTTALAATSTTIAGSTSDAGNSVRPPSSTNKPSTRPTIPATAPPTTAAPSHTHSTTPEQRLAAQSGWPRPFDPALGPDLAGIGGVTEVQFQRARAIISATAAGLAKYTSVSVAEADGYKSIGDGILGYEHYVKWSLIQDGRVLDANAPESLVYRVNGGTKTLVSAMYIAHPGTDINDPTLVSYAGPLMQWHVHSNLCWSNGRVVGLTDDNGNCSVGSASSGVLSPMVHVWIVAHPCGPFAAVEGVAAGVAQASDEERLDLCNRH